MAVEEEQEKKMKGRVPLEDRAKADQGESGEMEDDFDYDAAKVCASLLSNTAQPALLGRR
jgi:hypothetical protein